MSSVRTATSRLASFPSKVRIVEVGPRDGLQNEVEVPTDVKVELINRLSRTGLKVVEATAFVSKTKVPRMADHEEVCARIDRVAGVSYPVLTPNIQGYKSAVVAGMKEVAVFTAASESFCQRNTNCSIAESIERFKPVLEQANKDNIAVRGYISCIFADPEKVPTEPSEVARVAKILYDMGCYEISLGDTTGVGTPLASQAVLDAVLSVVPVEAVAVHFHNTYGQALANILVALQNGVSVIDSSVAGLGGCPYAKGATGNVATEDVVYMLSGMGIDHGVDLEKLLSAGRYISKFLKKAPASGVNIALSPKDYWKE